MVPNYGIFFPQCERFYIAWRKAMRRLCNISPRTHCNLLPLIVGDDPVDVQLHRRFVNFFSNLLSSTNSCVQILSKLALNSNSNVSKSVCFISRKYGIDFNSLPSHVHFEPIETDLMTAASISDFLTLRFHSRSPEEILNINEILSFLCTS